MDPWLGTAALVAFAIFLLHTFAGGPAVAAPLLAAQDLGRVAKLTSYYCWHLVTIVLLAMSLSRAYAAWQANAAMVWLIWLLAVAFALLNIGLSLRYRMRVLELPQWIVFVLLAAVITPALTLP